MVDNWTLDKPIELRALEHAVGKDCDMDGLRIWLQMPDVEFTLLVFKKRVRLVMGQGCSLAQVA